MAKQRVQFEKWTETFDGLVMCCVCGAAVPNNGIARGLHVLFHEGAGPHSGASSDPTVSASDGQL